MLHLIRQSMLARPEPNTNVVTFVYEVQNPPSKNVSEQRLLFRAQMVSSDGGDLAQPPPCHSTK